MLVRNKSNLLIISYQICDHSPDNLIKSLSLSTILNCYSYVYNNSKPQQMNGTSRIMALCKTPIPVQSCITLTYLDLLMKTINYPAMEGHDCRCTWIPSAPALMPTRLWNLSSRTSMPPRNADTLMVCPPAHNHLLTLSSMRSLNSKQALLDFIFVESRNKTDRRSRTYQLQPIQFLLPNRDLRLGMAREK